MKMLQRYIVVTTLLFSSLAHSFTYQGELSDAGILYSGTADIEFRLYKAASNGDQVGGGGPANQCDGGKWPVCG